MGVTRRYSGMAHRFAVGTLLAAVALMSVAVAPLAARAIGVPLAAVSPNVQAACPAPTPGTVQCFALRRTDIPPLPQSAVTPFTVPSGYGPADLQSAYKLPSGTAGAGMTVAVVDAYDLPTAEADLAAYRTQFGLPACTSASGCFKKVNQNGLTSPLPAANAGWGTEIALDIDMVSATCPLCHILLVEGNSANFSDLATSVDSAVSLGAMAVSNSYGAAEGFGGSAYDSHYNHPGVAITVSTADCGYDCSGNYIGASWPATSPNVVAVGGTNLTPDGSARGWTESAWGVPGSGEGAGSGCSASETKPSWQHDAGCSNRTIGDVSAVADPATGVAVYDAGAWIEVGGTSASSPIIAGVYALAGRPAAGSYPASWLYADTAHLYDVTTGTNDIWEPTIHCTVTYLCNGVVGYDGPTGLGTPNGVHAFTGPSGPTVTSVAPTSGPIAGGTSVIIHGTNFTGAQWVSFGGTAATSFTVNSATQITAVTPAHAAGLVNVLVHTASGTSTATTSSHYTYSAPAPTVSSVAPTSGSIAGGTTVIIHGTNFTGAQWVAFGGTAATSFTVNSATQITALAPAHGAGLVNVLVHTASGTSTATTNSHYTYS